jgi:hypothetical protein
VVHSEPWWALARVTGIVAVVGVVATAGLGIALGRRRRTVGPWTTARVHRQLTWLTLGVLGVHIVVALLDRHHVPPYAVVAPFLSPVRTVAAGMGSLATWGLLLVTVTAAGRRWLRLPWRTVHFVAYPAAVCAVAHSFLGSDPAVTLAVLLASLGAVALVAFEPWDVVGVSRGMSPRETGTRSAEGRWAWSEGLVRHGVGREPRVGSSPTAWDGGRASAPVPSGDAGGPQPLFAVHEIQGLIDWAERHPGPGAVVHGVLFALAALVFTLPLASFDLLWLSAVLAAICGVVVVAMSYRFNRGKPGRGGASVESAAPAGWLVPSQATVAPTVVCQDCHATQTVWAAVCSVCGAQLAPPDPVAGGREPGRPRRRLFGRYQPLHLKRNARWASAPRPIPDDPLLDPVEPVIDVTDRPPAGSSRPGSDRRASVGA